VIFTQEEKSLILEALRYRIQRTAAAINETENEEIRAMRERKLEALLSCRFKVATYKIIKRSPSDAANKNGADQEI
jgi:gamma-glutamyl phosphate reductase